MNAILYSYYYWDCKRMIRKCLKEMKPIISEFRTCDFSELEVQERFIKAKEILQELDDIVQQFV